MTPLERHIQLVSGFAARQAKQEDLAPLMETNVAPGQRAFVYRNSGMLACVEALRSNHKRLATLMGETAFGDMARNFIIHNPPTRRSLVGYGETLPAFIASHVDAHGLPWLADLARLDRAWLAAHMAVDGPVLAADAVAGLDEDALMQSRFTLHSSLHLVETEFDLWALWCTLDRGEAPEGTVAIPERPTRQAFLRPAFEVEAHPLTPASGAFLEALLSGETLAGACEAALAVNADADLTAMIAFSFQSGLFSARKTRTGAPA